MRIVMIADTHGLHRSIRVPAGDLLIHAGDITNFGELDVVADFNDWIGSLPHPHKVVIAGNHDFCFAKSDEAAQMLTNAAYLFDAETTVCGVRIWGSPWQPWFFDWAFNLQRGAEILAKWKLIPDGIDVLVTHGPPEGYGDLTSRGARAGCSDLLREVLERIRPRVHVFGHIHEGYGITHEHGVAWVNASTCDLHYEPVNPPLVLDLD